MVMASCMIVELADISIHFMDHLCSMIDSYSSVATQCILPADGYLHIAFLVSFRYPTKYHVILNKEAILVLVADLR